MKVKPAPGMTLRDPETYAIVPEEGIEVDDSDLYWFRRLADGDAVKVDEAPPETTEPPPEPEQQPVEAEESSNRRGYRR